VKLKPQKPRLLTRVDDATDAGSDAYNAMRDLEMALASNGLLRPHTHKTMKRYLQLWKVLKDDLQYVRVQAERREVVQRLGGMK
jgi:hypothetical protein